MVVPDDPFGTSWREMKAPKLRRQDAVVAEVGRWIVVAGGGCPAVKVYDKHVGARESAKPMPEGFNGSTDAMLVAASGERLYLIERRIGLVRMFDPKSKRWGSTCQLRSDLIVQSWAFAIGHDERLLVVGLVPACQSTMKVMFLEGRLFRRRCRGQIAYWRRCRGRWWNSSSRVKRGKAARLRCAEQRGGYVYNSSVMRNGAVFYEFAEEKGRIVGTWEWVPLPEMEGERRFGCSTVGLDELAFYVDIQTEH